MNEAWVRGVATLLGASGVAAAAFGSHGLEKHTVDEGLRWWAIAVAIQLVTAPVVLWCARSIEEGRLVAATPVLLSAGVVLFSGSLYAMALGAPRWLGAITPLGGLGLIVGWLLVAYIPR